ncbi:flavin monoamine oxidase family protein [Arthrobacter crystallopoietes]|uniref:Monoamine oxidase n=1 Tax=Crystallibacter crystallopoietes TaxID=37928 RepID=A0A1H1D8Y6_9MICC|nr:NAD(P)/FAD-dependent oxidoreductase [Arthrobacter crystallopoietes]AUI50419.1 amine oxidase [Arthrobacter crystallopoietes]SDQ72648.1 Monoamine oxidase [Arthrobacter crystallopoietes]
MSTTTDVIVIGAGFAGLTAARELTQQGRTVRILEARDRIAGRTWVENRMGRNLELGGTWVHWVQPHVWAEMTRYGIGVIAGPEFEKAYWWADGQRHEGPAERVLEIIDEPNKRLLEQTRELIPLPYQPLTNPAVKGVDHESVAARIDALQLDEEARQLLRTFWSLNFNGKIEDAAFTQALRWCSAASGDWMLMFEACATYKVQGGTVALAEAILADTTADLHLNTAVRRVEQNNDGVTVTTADGATHSAKAVIVTLPLNALGTVEFSPALSEGKQAAASRGQAGLGAKVWIKVKGKWDRFVAFGAEDWPINFVQSEYFDEDTTTLVAFGPDGNAVDVEDRDATQAVLEKLVPGIEVLEITGHSWVGDEYAKSTWPMHYTGYLSESLEEMQRPEGNVFLAGSDYANGWGGFIDGAIESGLTTARSVAAKVEQNKAQAAI